MCLSQHFMLGGVGGGGGGGIRCVESVHRCVGTS